MARDIATLFYYVVNRSVLCVISVSGRVRSLNVLRRSVERTAYILAYVAKSSKAQREQLFNNMIAIVFVRKKVCWPRFITLFLHDKIMLFSIIVDERSALQNHVSSNFLFFLLESVLERAVSRTTSYPFPVKQNTRLSIFYDLYGSFLFYRRSFVPLHTNSYFCQKYFHLLYLYEYMWYFFPFSFFWFFFFPIEIKFIIKFFVVSMSLLKRHLELGILSNN